MRKSAGNSWIALATFSSASRSAAVVSGPAVSSVGGCSSLGGWGDFRSARFRLTKLLCPMRNSHARKLLPARNDVIAASAFRNVSWVKSSARWRSRVRWYNHRNSRS
jgi:hypothetical protein